MLLIYSTMDNIIMDQRIGPTTIDKILSDAYERQMEIILLGTQEAEALQRKLVSAGRAKIDEQFEHLIRKQISLKRISRSESINHHRMIKIKKKYQLCQKIFEEVEHRLQKIATSSQMENQYALFLVQSITDGLVRMFEEKIFIRCRLKDRPLLQKIISLCKQSYRQYMAAQVGIDYDLVLEIAQDMHLQQRKLKPYRALQKAEEDKMCIGGVILADETGNITFKATFDSRLSILKDICLPDVRSTIWGNQKHSGNLK